MNLTSSHREARPMRKLSVVTWIGNAAAVLWGRWGDVSRQAETAGCSRQTVYQHARRVQQAVGLPKTQQRHFATMAAAMGLSSRQIARLLAIILPAALGPAPATVRHG